MHSENWNLNKIADGALREKVDLAMQEIGRNILDPNTDAKKSRKLTITIDLKPDEQREIVAMSTQVRTSLAPQIPIASKIIVGDAGDGTAEIRELLSGAKGQTFIADDGSLREDDGTPIDDAPAKSPSNVTKPLDLRALRAAKAKEAN